MSKKSKKKKAKSAKWDFPVAYKRCRKCQRNITREELKSRHHCKNHKA